MNRRTFLALAGAAAGSIAPLSAAFSRSIQQTSPAPPIRFLVVGDWGTGGKLQRQVAGSMERKADAKAPQFILSTGDNIYPDGVDSPDDTQWKTKFEDIYTGKSLQIPWYAVLGNHDYRKNPDAQIAYGKKNPLWNMPARYYSFAKKDGDTSIDFFALDTQQVVKNTAKEQLKWLEQALAQSTATWKIAFGHVMLRSHGHYGDQPAMLRAYKPLFDKYNLDVYFCGHDHDLQLLKDPDDRFHEVISGAGGGSRSTTPGKNTIFSATGGGFVYCSAAKDSLKIEFLNKSGEQLYAHTIEKR